MAAPMPSILLISTITTSNQAFDSLMTNHYYLPGHQLEFAACTKAIQLRRSHIDRTVLIAGQPANHSGDFISESFPSSA